MKAMILMTALLASAAFAGKPAPTPAPTTPPTATAEATSDAAAIAALRADLEQTQRQLQLQQQRQAQTAAAESTGGQGVGDVDVEGDENTYRSRALALSLPGLVAAPAVPGRCLEHLRGGGIASAGVTGRTKLNKECEDRLQCLAVADRLASWGFIDAAARQLGTCGGIEVDTTPRAQPGDPAQPDLTAISIRMEALEKRLADEELRNERRFVKTVGK